MLKIKNSVLLEYDGREKEPRLPKNIKSLGKSAFAWSEIERIQIPSQVELIEENAFKRCKNLREVLFEEGCQQIDDGAFSSCPNLQRVKLPESLKSMGAHIFEDCSALTDLSLPSSLCEIKERTFANCSSLSHILLPKNLKKIGDDAFHGCSALKDLSLPDGLEIIGNGSFTRCEKLQRISFPGQCKRIGDNAFRGCFDLEVHFSAPPVSVGKTAFPDTHLSIPDGIKEMCATSFLSREKFYACPEIEIPAGVQNLQHGFESLLRYDDYAEGHHTLRHILYLQKYKAKLFIGADYFSDGFIFKNGKMDFTAYDENFEQASDRERPYIAAYRLAYPISLSKKSPYIAALAGREMEMAEFAIQRNDGPLLRTVLNLSCLDSKSLDALYCKAHDARHFGLISFINQQTVNLDDIFSI